MRRVPVHPGTLYPLLARLEKAGWLKGRWENGSPKKMGRPRKRLYRLTPTGKTSSQAELQRFDDGY